MENIAKFLDNANHRPNATHEDIIKLCDQVIKYDFNSAFLNPFYIAYAKKYLHEKNNNKNSKNKIGSVIDFPLGQEIIEIKIASIRAAAYAGADELDMSINIGQLKKQNGINY